MVKPRGVRLTASSTLASSPIVESAPPPLSQPAPPRRGTGLRHDEQSPRGRTRRSGTRGEADERHVAELAAEIAPRPLQIPDRRERVPERSHHPGRTPQQQRQRDETDDGAAALDSARAWSTLCSRSVPGNSAKSHSRNRSRRERKARDRRSRRRARRRGRARRHAIRTGGVLRAPVTPVRRLHARHGRQGSSPKARRARSARSPAATIEHLAGVVGADDRQLLRVQEPYLRQQRRLIPDVLVRDLAAEADHDGERRRRASVGATPGRSAGISTSCVKRSTSSSTTWCSPAVRETG